MSSSSISRLKFQLEDGYVILSSPPDLEDGDEIAFDLEASTELVQTCYLRRVGDRIEVINSQGALLQIKRPCQTRETLDECLLQFLHAELPDLRLFDFENMRDILAPTKIHTINPASESRKFSFRIPPRVIQRMLAFYGKYLLVKGDFQAIKSKFMMALALRFWISGKSSLIVLRDLNADLYQLKSRFVEFLDRARQYMVSRGLDPSSLEIEFIEKELSIDQFNEFVTGSKPKIYLCIGHTGNLKKYLTSHMPSIPGRRSEYVLFLDEVDMMDGGLSDRARQFYILKNNAFCVFGVSATLLDKLMEEQIKRGELYLLSRPEGYKGIWALTHVPIAPQSRFTGKECDDILVNDPGMDAFLQELSKRQPPRVSFYDNAQHPIMTLINVAKPIIPMIALGKYIAESYGEQMVSIVFIGDGDKNKGGARVKGGIHLYSAHLRSGPITLEDGSESSYDSASGRHVIKGTAISLVYKYLHDHGGVVKFPRITTISGDLAGRGISFTSGNCMILGKGGKMNWHLTDLRFIPNSTRDIPECLQQAARGCVIAKDDIPIHLHCTQKTYDLIRHGYAAQEELIARAREIQEIKWREDCMDSTPVSNILPVLPMCWAKVKSLTGHPITKRRTLKLKKVKTPDGGWGLGEYNIIEQENIEQVSHVDNVHWLETNISAALLKGNDTIVLRVLRYFKKTGKDAIIDKEQLGELGARTIAHLSGWDKDKTYYQILIPAIEGFTLNPDVEGIVALV